MSSVESDPRERLNVGPVPPEAELGRSPGAVNAVSSTGILWVVKCAREQSSPHSIRGRWMCPGGGNHRASFSEGLVRIPILATTPPGGIVPDPFNGEGATAQTSRFLVKRSPSGCHRLSAVRRRASATSPSPL